MLVHSWHRDEQTYEPAYNVMGMRLPRLGDEPYEGGAWVSVAPASTMTQHVNPPGESEIFFVLAGSGEFIVDTASRRIGPGDSVFVPKGAQHVLHNDGTEEMRLLALWWGATDPAELAEDPVNQP